MAFALISAELSTLTPGLNRPRSLELGRLLAAFGLLARAVSGSWDGRPEASYKVKLDPGGRAARAVDALARYFEQAAWLEVDELTGRAMMHGADGLAVPQTDVWTRVSAADAAALPGWTLINGIHYALVAPAAAEEVAC